MNSLTDKKIIDCLAELQRAAAGDGDRWAARQAAQQAGDTAGAVVSQSDPLVRMGEFYLGVSPEEGRLLYLLARSCQAKTIVEFGASYGISTLHLGAAARDNSGGLITTEVHPDKCVAILKTITQAGLEGSVTLLEGDALETLKTLTGPVDLLFLDGWKGLYLPLLELLRPQLRVGSLIAADNVDHAAAAPYLQAIRADTSFVSSTFGDMEVSCFTG